MRTQFAARRLKENFRSQRPTKILYLDVECYQVDEGDIIKLPFRLAVTCYEHIDKSQKSTRPAWNIFTTQESLSEYIASKAGQKERLLIVTHNAEFDTFASGILLPLTADHWKLKFYYANGMMFILSCAKEKRKITIISTTNFYQTSIEALGKMLGLPKLKVDLKSDDDNLIAEYCRRDVEICRLAFKKWIEVIDEGDYGGFKLTKASQALTAFRHRFMRHPIYPHDEDDIKKLERRSYAGGRCENFYIGKYSDGPFVKLDFNSNYASVMIKNAFPNKLVGVLESPSCREVSDLLKTQLCVADVVINTDKALYPIKANHKLIFPIGEFKCTLCSRALQYAIDEGHIAKIGLCAVYSGRPIFKDYITHFYAKKLEAQLAGNLIFRTVYKYLMNTLYGKFAERRPIRKTRTEYDGTVARRVWVFCEGEIGHTLETKILNTVFEDVGYVDTPHTFTAISSHVTEDARMLLASVYDRLGWDKVMYSDTDSIITREEHLSLIDDLIDNERLGALTIEDKADEVELLSPKNYRFGDDMKMKGIPKKHDVIGPNKYRYESFKKSISLIKECKISTVEIVKVTKELKHIYTKGKVSSNGKISPFVLPFDAPLLYHVP